MLELAAQGWIDVDPTAEDTPCRGGREVGIVEQGQLGAAIGADAERGCGHKVVIFVQR